MRILITNDDGINAPGLAALHDIAAELAGPEGEVWTVAPAFEQSGVAHCISYSRPTLIAELSPRRWAAEGSPADCVLAAISDIMAGSPPDLVLSGVNRGNNAGENAMYSGTVGGAMEAALQGLPAIALSQYLGPPDRPAGRPVRRRAGAWGAAGPRSADQGGLVGGRRFPAVLQRQLPPLGPRRGQGRADRAAGTPARGRFGVNPMWAEWPSFWGFGGPKRRASRQRVKGSGILA